MQVRSACELPVRRIRGCLLTFRVRCVLVKLGKQPSIGQKATMYASTSCSARVWGDLLLHAAARITSTFGASCSFASI
jgi:hypothetical protein